MHPEHLPNWPIDRPLPNIPQPSPVASAGCTWGWILVGWGLAAVLLLFAIHAHAAETLPAVSPLTDWTGVGVVAVIAVLAVAIVGYVVHIKRTPGQQMGEEQLERLADLLSQKQGGQVPRQPMPGPLLTLDGITFADQAKLDEYKAAKAIIASYSNPKGDAP